MHLPVFLRASADGDAFLDIPGGRFGPFHPDGQQCEGAHAPDIHRKDQHELAGLPQRGRDAGGQAHRAEGGNFFQQDLGEIQPRFQHAQQEGPRADHDQAQQGHGGRLGQRTAGQAAVERAGLPLGKDAPYFLHEHEEGGRLDTAARGPRRRADEHEHDEHEQAAVAHFGQRHGGKARRAGRYAVEERRQPAHVVGDLQQHRAHRQQRQRGGQHHFGVQRELAEVEAAFVYVHNDKEADAAQNDQHAGDQIQPHAVMVGDQVAHAAQNIEARVVERRDGVEHADPCGVQRREVPHEHREAPHRPGQLEPQCEDQYAPHQADHAFQTVHVEGLAHEGAALEADAPPRGQRQPHTDGGDAQAPHLDERRHNELAHGGEGIGGVHHDQAGDADGAGRSEQRVGPCDRLPRPDGHRQLEQQRTQQDDQRKAHCDQTRGGLPFYKICDWLHIVPSAAQRIKKGGSLPVKGSPAARRAPAPAAPDK